MLGTSWIYVSLESRGRSHQYVDGMESSENGRDVERNKGRQSQEPKTEFWAPVMLKGLREEEPAKDSAKELSVQQEENPRTLEF